jgi:hypothetical protein
VPKVQDARQQEVQVIVPKINEAVNEEGTEEGPMVAAKAPQLKKFTGKEDSVGDEFVYQHTDGR